VEAVSAGSCMAWRRAAGSRWEGGRPPRPRRQRRTRLNRRRPGEGQRRAGVDQQRQRDVGVDVAGVQGPLHPQVGAVHGNLEGHLVRQSRQDGGNREDDDQVRDAPERRVERVRGRQERVVPARPDRRAQLLQRPPAENEQAPRLLGSRCCCGVRGAGEPAAVSSTGSTHGGGGRSGGGGCRQGAAKRKVAQRQRRAGSARRRARASTSSTRAPIT